MRFNEFNEGIDPGAKAAIKGMRELSGDQYYGLYKTMKDVAGHDGEKQTSPEGATDHEVSDKPFAYAYTDAEKKMIKGVDPKAKQITSDKSEEVKEAGEMSAPLNMPTAQQWGARIKSLYPDVQFIHQKMLNGVTFAMSARAGGKIGFYDPKNLVARTVPVGGPVLEADEKKINVEAKCKVCGTPYKVHFRFEPQGDPYGKITHTLVRGICGRVPGDFPGLNGETVNTPSRPDPIAAMQASLSNPRPSSGKSEFVSPGAIGNIIGYVPRVGGRPTGKIVKAEVLEIGGMIGRSAVRVKLLDPQDIAANGGKLTAIISQFQIRQNPYVGESVSEDFEDMPNELMDPQAWKALDIRQKYKALFDAGLVKPGPYDYGNLAQEWMNDDGSTYPLNHMFGPRGLKDGSLDLNKIYRSAQADYQSRKHSSDLTSQDRENELNIGSEGRTESKRKADELAEMRREKLRQEKLHDEETAFQRAETVQQREDEMKKIADQYKHDLTVIDKEHGNNMEAIKTSNKFELDKLDKEYADAQRERDFKGSETDKEYADAQRERDYKSGESDKEFRDRNADRDFRSGESDKEFRDRNQDREFKSGESDKDYKDRQREREHQQSMADKEREQSRPEPEEPRPRPRPQRPSSGAGNRFDQDTGEPTKPSKPEPQTWHTSQQVGSTAKDDEDDIEDVESRPFTPYTPRPSKPAALPAPKREGKYDNNRTGFSRGARDDERHDLDVPRPLIFGLKINGKIWKKDGNTVTFFTKERALAARSSILAKRPDVEVGLVQRPQD